MKFELDFLPRDASDEDLLEEVRRVDAAVGKEALTRPDFDRNSKISSCTLVRRFGSWHDVLRKAGIGHKYSGPSVTDKMRVQNGKYLSDDQVIEEIRRVARVLNKSSMTKEDLRANSETISAGILRGRFGSWEEGMRKAGLEVSAAYHRRFSDEEYFENLLNVWTHYGRRPLCRELRDPPSKIGGGGYEQRFGSFRKALAAFVARMNQDDGEDEGVSEDRPISAPVREVTRKVTVSAEDRRSIRLGLRWQVFNRDRFKCVACGASPATDPTCVLHVDHIVPYSRGGKTTPDNLRVLCEKCNLGKGNRHSE